MSTPPSDTLSPEDFYPLTEFRHCDPHRVLGVRVLEDGKCVLRVLDPSAEEVEMVFRDGAVVALERRPGGLFEAVVPQPLSAGAGDYLVRTIRGGIPLLAPDPYAFAPTLGELDLHLLGQGTHLEAYRVLGAHPRIVEDIPGTSFALWAPNAQRVSVVGDFNSWDGRRHMMRRLGGSGIWEIFLPGVGEGAHYKFEIRGQDGSVFLKTDPFAFFAQHDLSTACMVFPSGRFGWGDAEWMESRRSRDPYASPMSVYEIHLGSWKRADGNRPLTYLELAEDLVSYVKGMGFTHVEFLPVMEHPFEGSWGYQVVNFFAPSSRFGNPDEFRHLVDALHRAGIGVILDWVPGHFPKDAHGLARFDGTALYEHEDPRLGEHMDWGTLIFNYGRNEVRNFLLANALFWLDEFHIDGLRVDAVASMLYLDYSRRAGEWIPNLFGGRENLDAIGFLRDFNTTCHARHPGILTIAEESTAWPGVSRPVHEGGLGFSFKWNMGWMNDSLRYIARDPVHRAHHQGEITFSMLYAYHEHFVLVLSHDEVVHGKGSLLGKMPGDDWQKAANLRMFLSWMWAHPGKKLLFQGGEIGQWTEWNHAKGIDWGMAGHPPHAGLQSLVRRLNELYLREPALTLLDDRAEGFEWVDFRDTANTVWSFLRKAPQGCGRDLLVVVNATPVPRKGYVVGVPAEGRCELLLDSDAAEFGGSGSAANPHHPVARPGGIHGRPASLTMELPPLGVLVIALPS